MAEISPASREVARTLADGVGLLRRQWKIDGQRDVPEFASLELVLRALADPDRQVPTSLALAMVEPDHRDVLAYDYATVARYLSVSTRTVERLVQRGELAVIDVGGTPRVPHNVLTEWISDGTHRRGSFRDSAELKVPARAAAHAAASAGTDAPPPPDTAA